MAAAPSMRSMGRFARVACVARASRSEWSDISEGFMTGACRRDSESDRARGLKAGKAGSTEAARAGACGYGLREHDAIILLNSMNRT